MNSTMDSNWYFALNNGNGTFTKQLACTLGVYDNNFTGNDDNKFDCLVYDFDLDGKSDVVITKAMYTKHSDITGSWGTFDKTYTYWLRSTGSSLVQVSSATSLRNKDALSANYVLGDFNGDGQTELMNYGYNCYNSTNTNANLTPIWNMYKNNNFNAGVGKVSSVTDGFGNSTNIAYASLVTGGIYTKGSGSAYPMADYTLPVYAVKTVNATNGAAGAMTTNYSYNGLKAHLQGRGLLGFSSTTATNTTLGTTTESGVISWNTSFYIPSATYTQTTVDGKVARTDITMTVVDKGAKKYFAYPATQKETDLDGNIVTTTRTFDPSYGYLTAENIDFGNSMYKNTQYGNYVLAGGAYQPQLITQRQKHTDDVSTFTSKKWITYDATKGYQKQVIDNYGSTLPLTTDYTYDNFGNVKTSKASGTGVNPVTECYDYDATKRFVAKSYTSPASLVKTFTYDIWGNALTEKDETNPSYILTGTNVYDNWGNLKSTVIPDGTKTTYLMGWYNSPAKRYYKLVQGSGQPWVKTWYDSQGREVLVETIGAKSMKIQKATTYNPKGQVMQKDTKTGDITITEKYLYDNRGRVLYGVKL